MNSSKRQAAVLYTFLLLLILHQDFWYWDSADLVFGFIPVGLAYHAGYSVAAAFFWFIAMQYAWPHEIEAEAELPAGPASPGGGR